MKQERITIEQAFGDLSMDEILRTGLEAYKRPLGNQERRKEYERKMNNRNPRLSKKEQRSLRRRGFKSSQGKNIPPKSA